jgi:citrate synthase
LSNQCIMTKGYFTAKQASQKLGVSLSTLYAYVSRGLIRSEPDTVKRRRRYRAEDVEALLAKKSDKITSDGKLAQSLSWGDPVCDSHLTLIEDGEIYYRGQDLTTLLKESSFEDVVGLLWEGYEPADEMVLPDHFLRTLRALEPINRFSLLLPWCSEKDPRAFDLRPEAVRLTGSKILRALFASLGPVQQSDTLTGALAREWCPGKSSFLDAALILCADHELNVSAFTARCAASAGASPYAVVQAGMAALSGFRHGANTYRVEALFREAEALGAEGAVCSYLRRGLEVPGFGHRLYPDGDPRGRDLLALLDPLPEEVLGLTRAADELLDGRPNVDFALVALARSLGLPAGAPLTLFALGRCAGWIAHALEQYATGKLIRPRARYVGKLPVE